MLPSRMGERKVRLSTEAVTTWVRQCRIPTMAAALLMRAMTRPPKMLPRGLVSSGMTSSVMVTREADTGLAPGRLSILDSCLRKRPLL